jgi:predicted nucleotidyltransferase
MCDRDSEGPWQKSRFDMDMQVRQVVGEFVRRAQSLYGDKLKCVLVYGSCARDEVTAESDIDLAVVLAGDVVPGKEIDRMIDIITDMNLEYGVLLSVYPVSEENFQNTNSPLLMNIRREGIVV